MPDILIIDDDRLMSSLLAEWLSAEGYSVQMSAPGDANPPKGAQLVIVDVYMPRSDGAQVILEVKSAHPRTPLIAISGQFRPGLRGASSAARKLGVRQAIAKPFSRRDLLSAVQCVIGPAR